jgi:signal transduction histidine kinase
VIADISDNLRIFLDTEKIYEYIYQKLSAAFRFRSFGVLFYDKTKKKYKLAYNKGFNVGKKKLFDRDPVLQKEFINKDKPIVIEEIKGAYKKGRVKKMLDYLDSLEVKVVAPLNTQDETIGILVFGPKESGDIYNEEDLEVIKIIGNQAAITIENARLYEETRNFNTKLKREVDKATRGLRAANERLRRLDRAKTDFISIASHQLRTPLTIIRGYVSMLLENNFGKLGKKQDEALRKVSASSERLIGLVEDLLNISRIESGRMEYNFKKTDLAKLIQGVYEELKPAAEKKKLRFVFNRPRGRMPKVNIDPDKIRQVLMNLIDNAIKYTDKGSVTIELKKKQKQIEVCIQDTGMGFGSGEKSNLFQKFSRNEKTDLIHTEGTGLGLYVAKQIVNGHKGKIRAESPGRGKGSRFCFSLPVGKK